jgi:hypothetical protein
MLLYVLNAWNQNGATPIAQRTACYQASAKSVQHTIFGRVADLYRVHFDVVLRKLVSQ